MPKATAAKRFARKHQAKIRPDWDRIKDTVMDRALRAKFAQHRDLRALLLGTGDEAIDEDSPKDYYWGIGADGTGQNKLGEMLMRLRAELRGSAATHPSRDAPLFAWLGPLVRFAEIGTARYPRNMRRRLTIVNVMAMMIAVSSAVYAGLFAVFGVDEYWPLIVANLAPRGRRAAGAARPSHQRRRRGAADLRRRICGAVLLRARARPRLRHPTELHRGRRGRLRHLRHGPYPPRGRRGGGRAGAASRRLVSRIRRAARASTPIPFLLHNLYVSSAATTFTIIALIVGYAFTMADRARAEADSLLANILPEAIAERLKARPGERVADAVPQASVLFSDLVGFTALAQELGAARTVAILDQSSPSSTGWRPRTAWRRSRPSATAIWRWPASASRNTTMSIAWRAWRSACPAWWRGCRRPTASICKIRIGIAGGPVMAGVIGADKFSYDVWGETVNLASRLESHGLPGEIQVSGAVRDALGDGFVFEARGRDRGEGRRPARDLAAEGRARGEPRSRIMTWRATVLTLYPEMFPGPLGLSLAGKALADGTWALETFDIRSFATDKHRSVDDTPAGGGAGMVMRADIAALAIDAGRARRRPRHADTLSLAARRAADTSSRP